MYRKYVLDEYTSDEEETQINEIMNITMNLFSDDILNQMYGIMLLSEAGTAVSVAKPVLKATPYKGYGHPDPIYQMQLGGETAFCGGMGKHCRSYYTYKTSEGQYKKLNGPIGYIIINQNHIQDK